MMLLPALTQSTRRERHDYWRKWTRHADRETRYQAGMLTGKREIGSGPTIALHKSVYANPMTGDYWLAQKDGNESALALYKQHYSYRKYADGRNPKLFVGPGEKMVLLTTHCDALFVWRKFISLDHQEGVNCAVFRNESPIRASELIAEAMDWAWRRWPGQRLYTYVNAEKVKGTNPGLCFKEAGWHFCGWTAGGLLVFDVPGMVARLLGRGIA